MTKQEIYEIVDKYIKENLSEVPFNKGLPVFQAFLWSLGEKNNMTGPEILKICFDNISK